MREVETGLERIQGPRRMILLTCAWLALALFSGAEPALAQQGPDHKALAQARSEYKSSLEQLLALYEADDERDEERLAKMKALYGQGLVTRHEVETSEDDAVRAREKVVEARAQLLGADVLFAEALVEAEAVESAPKVMLSSAPRAVGGLVRTTAYIRFGGARAWSLSGAGAIKQFFMQRFGRALPIDAFGQSPLHDRWSYDHRNAMDVGLSPGSVEGQVLMEYLRASGIPFTAFHFAVPGKATGPHIHVGLPSHKIAAR